MKYREIQQSPLEALKSQASKQARDDRISGNLYGNLYIFRVDFAGKHQNHIKFLWIPADFTFDQKSYC